MVGWNVVTQHDEPNRVLVVVHGAKPRARVRRAAASRKEAETPSTKWLCAGVAARASTRARFPSSISRSSNARLGGVHATR